MNNTAPLVAGLLALVGVVALAAALASIARVSRPAGDVERIEQALAPPKTILPPTTGSPPDRSDRLGPVDRSPIFGSISPNPTSRIEELTSPSSPTPIRLTVPAIGIDAPVVPYGVDRTTGEMEVPSRLDEVAWYRFGPAPGEPGSSVLAAHVDYAGRGPGVFFRLSELQPGDAIQVRMSDGTTRRFHVAARAVYDKSQLPLDVIFARSGDPVLTLITCGGGFNRALSRYDSNVVVYAIPAEPPPSAA
ncbi:MAG: hypothetical protein KatS3mg011_1650 [Acidimicrobiia bacterium]|nr:MAG: hypothetical protein KatS3mg011_1650 [Acidimicrobiia bacterium]